MLEIYRSIDNILDKKIPKKIKTISFSGKHRKWKLFLKYFAMNHLNPEFL
jgi:hypothetical protein